MCIRDRNLNTGLIYNFDLVEGVYSFEKKLFKDNAIALIYTNGDAALWGQLCSVDNPPPVRAITVNDWSKSTLTFTLRKTDFYDSTLFPVGKSVINQLGQVISLSASTSGIPTTIYFPMCIRQPSDPDTLRLADAWRAAPANLAPTAGHVASECAPQPNVPTPSFCTPLPYCPTTDKNNAQYIG